MSYKENYFKYSLGHGLDTEDGEWHPIRVDHRGHLAVHTVIEVNVHDGLQFGTGYYNASVLNNGTVEILLRLSLSNSFTAVSTRAGGTSLLEIYEDVVTSSDGTALPVTNLNRASSNTSNITAFHTPTVTADGTLFWQALLPGGDGQQSSGSSDSEFREGILKKNTDYLFRLTNLAGNGQPMQIILSSFEEPLET